MPEIWLRYGGTHVVLDIRFENLLKHISSNLELLTDEEARIKLGEVKVTENTLVLAIDGSKPVAKAIDKILDMNKSIDASKIYIKTFPKYVESLRMNIANKNYSIEKLELEQFDTIVKKFQKTLVISHTKYDPFFGYSGSPTALLRNFYPDRMTEAYNSRVTNLPTTGKRGPPLDIALSAFCETEAEAIELVSNSHGISAIFHDNIIRAFNSAVICLSQIAEAEEEASCNSAIISASNEEGPHETLLTSLNSLWNSIHLVKRNGSVVLLAENIKGVGDGALRNFVEGRIELQNAIAGGTYVEGLEHLLYLHELKSQYDLGIMSTLPHHYLAQKLGLYPYTGSKEILNRLVEKHGRNHKTLVISDADTILIRSK
jgi:hypothetical protein